jgi:tetratricopeptide (TPR) repeat protein
MQASPGHDRVPRPDRSGLQRSGNSEPTRPVVASRWRSKAAAISIALAVFAGYGLGAWEWLAWRESLAARRALAGGRFQEARDAAARLIGLRLRRAEAYYFQAKAAIALGRRGEYVDSLKQAEALGYPQDRLAVLRALIDAQYGRLVEAQPILAWAFSRAEPGTPDLMIDEALARVYLGRYDFAHASAVLLRWAKDDPNDPRPPLWRARLNRRRDADPDVVIADFREVLKRAPGHVDALRGIADQLDLAHRNREAVEAYDALLAVHPNDAAGHAGAGRNAAMLGDETAAISHLERALALDPNNASAHLERAKIDLRRNEPGAALAHLDRVVVLTPFNPDVHYQRSLALKRLGKSDESSQEHAIFAGLSRDQREREELQERLAVSPDDPKLESQLARWMLAHGYDQEGVNWANKILIDHPGHPETCLVLADYYERLGRWEVAKSYKGQITRRPR